MSLAEGTRLGTGGAVLLCEHRLVLLPLPAVRPPEHRDKPEL